MNRAAIVYIASCLLFASTTATARQGANSTALTLASGNVDVEVDNIVISLDGRAVRIMADVLNNEVAAKRSGFYAFTPFFWYLGTGDEYQDKSFSDVQATLNGKPLAPVVRRRGMHMGQDITVALANNGLAPLPDNNASAARIAKLPLLANMRLSDWQGFATFSWTFDSARGSNNALSFSYQALPEFMRTTAADGVFARKIKQHCGNVEQVSAFLSSRTPKSDAYIVHRFDIPVNFMLNKTITLTVRQPERDADGGKPLLSLVCSDTPAKLSSPSITDTVHDAGNAISILVISAPTD